MTRKTATLILTICACSLGLIFVDRSLVPSSAADEPKEQANKDKIPTRAWEENFNAIEARAAALEARANAHDTRLAELKKLGDDDRSAARTADGRLSGVANRILARLELAEKWQAESEKSQVGMVSEVKMWWGSSSSIPHGWEICDGKKPKTPGAILKGLKPDLIDKFPKGAPEARETTANLAKGGNNNMPALVIKDIAGLGVGSAGEHSHGIRARTAHNAGPDSHDDIVARGHQDRRHIHQDANTGDTFPAGAHGHPLSGYVGNAGGTNADGGDTSGANQPAFQEIFYIVKVL